MLTMLLPLSEARRLSDVLVCRLQLVAAKLQHLYQLGVLGSKWAQHFQIQTRPSHNRETCTCLLERRLVSDLLLHVRAVGVPIFENVGMCIVCAQLLVRKMRAI